MKGGKMAAQYSQPKWGEIFGNIQDQTDLWALLGGGSWGNIEGNITDQADLVNYVADQIPEGTEGVEFLNGSYQLGGSFTDVELIGTSFKIEQPKPDFITVFDNAHELHLLADRAVFRSYTDTNTFAEFGVFATDAVFTQNPQNAGSIKYVGFGETDENGTNADYSSLVGTSLTPKAFVSNLVTQKDLEIRSDFNDTLQDYLTLTQYNAERHFRGTYTSLSALNTAVPAANPGDFANVDLGVGEPAERYIWDDDDSTWVLSAYSAGAVESVNGLLPDGSGNVLLGLGDVSNVNLTAPANGELLQFNGTNWVNTTLPDGTEGVEFLNGSYQLGGSFTDVQLTGLAASSFFIQVENAGGFGGSRTHSINIDGANESITLGASSTTTYKGIIYPNIGVSGSSLLDYSLVHKGYVVSELSALESQLTNDFNTALSDYLTLTQYNAERHFRGTYTSLSALNTAVPAANPGDFANVDLGVGEPAERYIWDDDDSTWVLSASGGGSVESVNGQLPDGSGNVLLGLGNISNVDLTAPSNGELLQFNGTNWVNANPLADYVTKATEQTITAKKTFSTRIEALGIQLNSSANTITSDSETGTISIYAGINGGTGDGMRFSVDSGGTKEFRFSEGNITKASISSSGTLSAERVDVGDVALVNRTSGTAGVSGKGTIEVVSGDLRFIDQNGVAYSINKTAV